MEKWKQQLIRYQFHYSKARVRDQLGFLIKHPHIPPSLYKYRNFSDQHKHALSQGVLWRCSPERFNDPYDSVIFFDTERFPLEDHSVQELIKEMKQATASAMTWPPKPILNPIRQGELRRKITEELLKNSPANIRAAVLRATDCHFQELNEELTRSMSKLIRGGFSVLSLSENSASVLMWSHYSENHSGFCIEYNLSRDPLARLCYPVFYRKKLTDATRYLGKRDFRDFNNLFAMYTCLIKSDEWAYEREWRLVLPTGASDANSPMAMPTPSAIILGALVRPADEAWVRAFCTAHSVPLRRVVQRHNVFRLDIQAAS
jgi:Protein of unknown function (DUF2971)